MTHRVILDTGPLVAAIDSADAHHEWAVERLKFVRKPLIICEAVLVEALHLVRRSDSATAAIGTYLSKGLIECRCPTATSPQRIVDLMGKYRDVPMSFADACIVSLVEQIREGTVFTTDSDFSIYRQKNRRVIRTISP